MHSLAIVVTLSVAAVPAGLHTTQLRAPQKPLTYAQRLVNQMVAAHRDLAAMELALQAGEDCSTVAATDPKDIGEQCDDDELGPMRTGQPKVEAPTKEDPVYDITQALHDSAGSLIGAVGMDLRPAPGENRAAVVAQALALLHELEAMIPSKRKLMESASPPERHE
jgi:hypothetical protein